MEIFGAKNSRATTDRSKRTFSKRKLQASRSLNPSSTNLHLRHAKFLDQIGFKTPLKNDNATASSQNDAISGNATELKNLRGAINLDISAM